MRKFLTASLLILSPLTTYANEIVCTCPESKKCSEIRVNLLPVDPGVYMNVEYAYGEKNLEGFAQVTSDSKSKSKTYMIGRFIMVEKDNQYSLPNRDQVCN